MTKNTSNVKSKNNEKKISIKKLKRPAIPQDVQLELWIKAAGRCEFLGCNNSLWRDGLTLQRVNYSNISHIISWTPTGPRGDITLSAKLSQDITNLMLTCKDHGHLIDQKQFVKKYTVEKLISYKKNHEERIKIQTSQQENMRTKILIFSANIGNVKVSIPQDKTFSAIAPMYPYDEYGIMLDYTGLKGDGDSSYWENRADEITTKIDRELTSLTDSGKLLPLSIFAIGPIPLLIQLGASIGNAIPADLYQRHRDTEDWNWKEKKDETWNGYSLLRHSVNKGGGKIAVILSLSGRINLPEVSSVVDKEFSIYEITHDKPNRDYLSTKDQLVEFQKVYHELLTEIRNIHGSDCEIHLFPAVPVSIAVACGRELLPKIDPDMYVYDNNKEFGGFRLCLKIKKKV